MNFFKSRKNKKAGVVIDSSGASSVNILETILSPEGRKELKKMAEFAQQHNLQQQQQEDNQ